MKLSSCDRNVSYLLWASLVAQMVKNSLAMRETWVWSLGWEDTLEEGMATHSGILAWRIPWTEKPGGLQPKGLQRVGHNWSDLASTHDMLFDPCLGEILRMTLLFTSPDLCLHEDANVWSDKAFEPMREVGGWLQVFPLRYLSTRH